MEEKETVELTINKEKIAVQKGTTVHTAAAKLGYKVPIFCYHDRMPPFGACRICLVEIEGEENLKTSCTLEAKEGMVVKTQSKKAVAGRNSIMELLLINHPLDCPICDRGGECPLQEHALRHGSGKSRFFEEKRHFKKPVPRGPVLMLDRERCIQCARCTRFGELIAGDSALEFIDRGWKLEVGTPDGGPAKSKFIGNTIMICPVGALTSQVYRFRARPWDNDSAPSTCMLCPVGCSMTFDSRDGEVMRTRSREDRSVNDIWLCDKGWFGYEYCSHPDRLRKPLIRKNGKLEEAGWDEALALAAEKLKGEKVAGFGGNPLTTEENYLFQKLMRDIACTPHIDHRVGMPIWDLEKETLLPGMEMTLGECEELKSFSLLGVDLTEEFPVLWLRLKQAINKGAKGFFLGHFAPEIARHLEQTTLHPPGDELKVLRDHFEKLEKGALFVGRQYLQHINRPGILSEIKTFKEKHPEISLNILEGRGNSMGALFAGFRPDILPFGKPAKERGLSALGVLEEAAENRWDLLWVAGADPARKISSSLWEKARKNLGFLIVQDLFLTETASQADIVFPTLSWPEKEGCFINIEGRVQRIFPGKNIPKDLLSDRDIFTKVAETMGRPLEIDDLFFDELQKERVKFDTPPPPKEVSSSMEIKEGELLATFASYLFDEGTRMKHNPHLSEFAQEKRVRIHPSEGKKRGAADGDIVECVLNGQSVRGPISWDEKVAPRTVVLPLGFDEFRYQDLMNGLTIELKT